MEIIVSILNLIDNSIYEGLSYSLICLSMVLSYRLLNFPDITMEGSFVTGAAVTAVLSIKAGIPILLASFLGVLAGAVAGLFTAFLHIILRIDKLLSGVLSSFCFYSLNLIIMGGFIAYGKLTTLLTPFENADKIIMASLPSILNLHITRIFFMGIITLFMKLLIDIGLRTEKGLIYSVVGENEKLAVQCGINPIGYKFFGLIFSNMLVSSAGILISMKEGSANATRGIGIIIFALTSYVIGEHLMGKRSNRRTYKIISHKWQRKTTKKIKRKLNRVELTTAAIIGGIFYFLMIQLGYIVRIRPELPKLLMGLYIIIAISDRNTIIKVLSDIFRNKNDRTY